MKVMEKKRVATLLSGYYINPGELVLDYFCGVGTTAVECKLLNRKRIAFDINDKAIELAKENVNFNVESRHNCKKRGFWYAN